MFPALNAWTFPDGTLPEVQLHQAAAAGFAGVELVLAESGPLRPETPLDRFAELARRAEDLGLSLVSLATALFWEFNYASADPADRRRAIDLTLRMLDLAAAARAGAILVVPALVGRCNDPRPRVSYADALHRTVEALLDLRHEAEARAVTVALENVWNRFLLSPVELADVLDRVNSPHIGAYFDSGNVLAFGYPEDWIATLGGRISRVHVKDYDVTLPGPAGFCPLGEGSADWSAILAALHAAGYEGPLTYEGPGNPSEICRRLQRLLADHGRREKETS